MLNSVLKYNHIHIKMKYQNHMIQFIKSERCRDYSAFVLFPQKLKICFILDFYGFED